MLADRKTMESAISGQRSAKVLEGLLSQTFFNSLAEAKANRQDAKAPSPEGKK